MSNRWVRITLFVGIFMILGVGMLRAQDDAPNRVVAYYTSWSIYARDYFVTDVPAEMLTHINYAFANISPDGEIVLGDEWADVQYPYPGDPEGTGETLGNFRQLQLLKERNPDLQTLISVGGWTWSGRFSDVALTEESRATFAQSAVNFITRYGFDGVDLDWEYPTGGGDPGNTERPEDPENFILLLEAVRSALDVQGETDGRHYLLTIAAGAGNRAISGIDWAQAQTYLDFINVMTYDMAGGWSSVTGFNSPLYNSAAAPPEGTSVDTALQAYLAAGVPADKIVMGVAFYGKGWNRAGATNNGLHQSFTGLPSGTWEAGTFDYSDLAENYVGAEGWERFFSESAQVPWLYNAETGTMISYDDPESMTLKAEYVQEHGLGGVMFWELSGDDDDYSLLSALVEGLES